MNNAIVIRCLAIACLFYALACSTPGRSSGREVKKETKDKRKSPIVLTAKEGSYYINLRQNNFFDYFGLDSNNKAQLFAGSYEFEGDSLMMAFYNNNQPGDLTGKGLVDKAANQLILFSKDAAKNRKMDIIMNTRNN
ncbi:MAG: hypothetical protein ACTHMD_17560 [Flavisolibacter sp.]